MKREGNSFPDHVTYAQTKGGRPEVTIEGTIKGSPDEVIKLLEEIVYNLRRAYNINRPSAVGLQ